MKNKNVTKWWIFTITSMANLAVSFAINSLNLALPTLAKEFGVSQGEVSWLALVYSLIPCCMLLICGNIADLCGYKRQYIIGFSIFGIASLLAPVLSHNLLSLILFRALQGVGYSILILITQATISKIFDENERGKALGVNSVFVSVGLASGPMIGGFLLAHFSWHSIFYFCTPFCLIGFIATLIVMPDDKNKETGRIKLDWTGGLFFAVAIGSLAIGLNFSDEWGLISIPFTICIIIALISISLFILRERIAPAPLIPLQLFKNQTFSKANATCALSYMTQQMTTYLYPFFLINILLLQSDEAGLIFLASPIAMMITSPFGGSLSDQHGTRLPAVVGLSLIALSSVLVGLFKENTSIIFVLLVLCMVGAGNGLSVSAINSAILGSAPKQYSGIASGMLATMRNIGQTIGTAISSVMLINRQVHYEQVEGLSKNTIYLFAQKDTFFVGFILALFGILLVIQIRNTDQINKSIT